MFPALLFLLVSAMFARNKSTTILYGAFSIAFFMNCLDVLLKVHDIVMIPPAETMAFRPVDGFIALISFVNVVLAAYTIKLGCDIRRWTDL